MVPADRLNVDTGKVNTDDPNDDYDFIFRRDDEYNRAIVARNRTRFGKFGAQPPLLGDCMVMTMLLDSMPINSVVDDIYLCYRSSQGLPGYLHISPNSIFERTIWLEYLTWSIP